MFKARFRNRFALSWLYSFSMPWCPIGMTIEEWYCSFIPFEDAWREPRPCRVQPRAYSGEKENCELHPSIRITPWHPTLIQPTAFDGGSFIVFSPGLRSNSSGGLQAPNLPLLQSSYGKRGVFLREYHYVFPLPPCKVVSVVHCIVYLTLWLKNKIACVFAGWSWLHNL